MQTIATQTEITLETIRLQCGYQNFDAIRQAWYSQFGKENGFPDKNEPIETTKAIVFLSRISRPYPNKPEAAIQGALRLLEGLHKGDLPPISTNGNGIANPVVFKRQPRQQKQPAAPAPEKSVSLEEQTRAQLTLQRAQEEKEARERYNTEQAAEKERYEKLDSLLSPWITGLTWGLNYLEMTFLVVGLWYVAGIMGLIAGGFLIVLGSIILLLIRLRGSAGGYAVFAWFIVCSIGGWLVEYPAMLNAVIDSNNIVSSDGETYAGISTEFYAMLITFLMSGSSFAGTYFRYQKSRD